MAKIRLERALTCAITLLLLCFAADARAKDSKPLKMGYSAWPGWNVWKVTEEKGFSKRRGSLPKTGQM